MAWLMLVKILEGSFLAEKDSQKRYNENKVLGLAWDLIKMR